MECWFYTMLSFGIIRLIDSSSYLLMDNCYNNVDAQNNFL